MLEIDHEHDVGTGAVLLLRLVPSGDRVPGEDDLLGGPGLRELRCRLLEEVAEVCADIGHLVRTGRHELAVDLPGCSTRQACSLLAGIEARWRRLGADDVHLQQAVLRVGVDGRARATGDGARSSLNPARRAGATGSSPSLAAASTGRAGSASWWPAFATGWGASAAGGDGAAAPSGRGRRPSALVTGADAP